MKLRKIKNFEILTEKSYKYGTSYEEGCEFIIRVVDNNARILHLISGYHKPYFSQSLKAMITKYCYRDYYHIPTGKYSNNLKFLKEFLT